MRTIVIIIFCLSLFGCSASGRIDDVSKWYRVIKFSVDKIQSAKKDNKINDLQG